MSDFIQASDPLHRRASEELCNITLVSRVKACGGKLNAMLLEVPLAALPKAADVLILSSEASG